MNIGNKIEILKKLIKDNGIINVFEKYVPRIITNRALLELDYQWILYKRYKKKYNYLFDRISFIDNNRSSCSCKDIVIWTMWLQGEDNAPQLVKRCFQQMRLFYGVENVIVIDERNVKEYVNIPEYVWAKYKDGIISRTHFSDIIRVLLLCTHGGVWIDSTCYLSDRLPAEFFSTQLFAFQNPDCFFGAHKASSWFIIANKNSLILNLVRLMLLEFWKKNNKLDDYFLFHVFFSIATDATDLTRNEWSKVPFFNNDTPQIMRRELSLPYNANRFASLCKMSSIHKLSYKLDVHAHNSIYDYLCNS